MTVWPFCTAGPVPAISGVTVSLVTSPWPALTSGSLAAPAGPRPPAADRPAAGPPEPARRAVGGSGRGGRGGRGLSRRGRFVGIIVLHHEEDHGQHDHDRDPGQGAGQRLRAALGRLRGGRSRGLGAHMSSTLLCWGRVETSDTVLVPVTKLAANLRRTADAGDRPTGSSLKSFFTVTDRNEIVYQLAQARQRNVTSTAGRGRRTTRGGSIAVIDRKWSLTRAPTWTPDPQGQAPHPPPVDAAMDRNRATADGVKSPRSASVILAGVVLVVGFGFVASRAVNSATTTAGCPTRRPLRHCPRAARAVGEPGADPDRAGTLRCRRRRRRPSTSKATTAPTTRPPDQGAITIATGGVPSLVDLSAEGTPGLGALG